MLKFLSSSFSGIVPKYEGQRNSQDDEFVKNLYENFK